MTSPLTDREEAALAADAARLAALDVRCVRCRRKPHEIEEYLPGTEAQVDAGERAWVEGEFASPAAYCAVEEGTFNPENGHFACTECYVDMGCPSAPFPGWKAP